MYLTYNEGKSAVAERFIRNLKNRIYKYMNSILKNMYTNKINDIVNKNSKRHIAKLKWILLIESQASTFIDFDEKIIKKILNLKLVIM